MRSRPAVFLGLGSNVGDREATLGRAVTLLARRGFRITARSSLYLTEPVGGPPQDWYVNTILQGETDLSPEDLLAVCLAAEKELGRVRETPLGPRTLDIDLLLYGDEVRSTSQLTLPHPRLHERLFVLVPLVEIAPETRHPIFGVTAAKLLERCSDDAQVLLHTHQGSLL